MAETAQKRPYKVFIAYDTLTGLDLAAHVREALWQAGVPAFVAKSDLEPGEPWDRARWQALEESLYFVVVLTINVPKSKQVKKEIRRAEKGHKRVLPCCADGDHRERYKPLFKGDELQYIDFESKEDLARKLVGTITDEEDQRARMPYVDGAAPAAVARRILRPAAGVPELQEKLKRGKTRDAEAQARVWVKGGGDLARQGYSLLARALLVRGDRYYHRGNYAGARKLYEQAVNSARKSGETDLLTTCWYELGAATGTMGNYDQAVKLFGWVIARQPHNGAAYYNRGVAYDHLGQYQEAIADYTRAIEHDPKLAAAYNNRGWAYGNLGQYEEAIADYTKAIDLAPEDRDAYNNRGVAYHELKQYKEAIADYTRAIELDPKYAFAYNNRGVAYRGLKQHQQAIADYTEAIQLDPKYAAAYNNRGIAYQNLGKKKEAQVDFARAEELRKRQGGG